MIPILPVFWIVVSGMYLALSVTVFSERRTLQRALQPWINRLKLRQHSQELDLVDQFRRTTGRVLAVELIGFFLAAIAAVLELYFVVSR